MKKHMFLIAPWDEPGIILFVCLFCGRNVRVTSNAMHMAVTTEYDMFADLPDDMIWSECRGRIDRESKSALYRARETGISPVRDGGDNQGHRQALSGERPYRLPYSDVIWHPQDQPGDQPKKPPSRWHWPWNRGLRE